MAILLVAAGVIVLVGAGDGRNDDRLASFGKGSADLLPDLVTERLREVYTESTRGRRLLRFTHGIVNLGKGPLEIHPVRDDCGDKARGEDYGAEQWIFRDSDDDGRFDREVDTDHDRAVVGCLIFHRLHNHWHIDDFVRYDLFAYGRDGELRPRPVRTSGKVSFCVVDSNRRRPDLPGAPAVSFYQVLDALPGDCEEGTTIGLSVGYGDEYRADLVDQWIDVSGLDDGPYCLATATDVNDIVPELDEADNNRRRKVHLTRRRAEFGPDRGC